MGTSAKMRRERSDVGYPMWRKKVDYSLFGHRSKAGTTIPRWMWRQWDLEAAFGDCNSARDPRSNVVVVFEGRRYSGHVTLAKEGRANTPAFRLWLDDKLAVRLRSVFPMSYLRSLERVLADSRSRDVEAETPFWEFLDIEFDAESRTFHLNAHYTQRPVFPSLFEHVIESTCLEGIGRKLEK